MSTNIKINGKDITKEDVSTFLNNLSTKLSDSDNNKTLDLVDMLNKKGVSGKVIGSLVNTYLTQKTKSGDTVVSVLKNKIDKMEEQVEDTKIINKEEKVVNTSTDVKNSVDYSTTNLPINTPIINSNPFLQVLIYALIAAVITVFIVAIIK